jgi:hypothetical protein
MQNMYQERPEVPFITYIRAIRRSYWVVVLRGALSLQLHYHGGRGKEEKLMKEPGGQAAVQAKRKYGG